MTPHSIVQAAGTHAHRPMSLLLQALKRIESRSPAEPVIEPTSAMGANLPDRTPVAQAEQTKAPQDAVNTFHLIRQYHEAETASEIAVADPLTIELPSLTVPSDDSGRGDPNRPGRGERRRLAEDIIALLPDESRSVMAILPADGVKVSPLVIRICQELAVCVGDVLAIAEPDPTASGESSEKPTFSDVVAGRATWRDALLRPHYARIGQIARGGFPSPLAASPRRLLKLWEEIGEQFSYVVLDASAGDPDDVMPILATCDAAFIAIRLHETHRRETERLIGKVRSAGCQPCGCLVVDH